MVDPVKVKCGSKEEFRAMFPEVAVFADAIRAEFGSGVKLVYAEESGRCVGTKSVCDPERTVNLSEMVLDSRPYAEIVAERERGWRNGKCK